MRNLYYKQKEFRKGLFQTVSYTVKLLWLEHRWLIYCGWVEHVFESLGNSSDDSRKQIFRDILGKLLIFCENLCFVYSLELLHPGDPSDY